MTALAPLLQAFFSDRLVTQRHASVNTIAAYRDTFKLLLAYVQGETGKTPAALDIGDLDATRIGGFLIHLERVRGNSARTRNARLAAIHSLFSYAALRHPSMPTPSPGSSRSPQQESNATSSPGSPTPRPPPCWTPATQTPAPADVITRCSPSRSRPECASAS
ncbi:MAG: site-specific integrase [Phycisphaeraceae bacterium]